MRLHPRWPKANVCNLHWCGLVYFSFFLPFSRTDDFESCNCALDDMGFLLVIGRSDGNQDVTVYFIETVMPEN